MNALSAALDLVKLYAMCQELTNLCLRYTLPDAYTSRHIAVNTPSLGATHREALILLGNLAYAAKRHGSATKAHLDCIDALVRLADTTQCEK